MYLFIKYSNFCAINENVYHSSIMYEVDVFPPYKKRVKLFPIKQIQKCLQTSHNFIVIPVDITDVDHNNKRRSHATVIIIDRKSKQFMFFDPHEKVQKHMIFLVL